MGAVIRFILNDVFVETSAPAGMVVLDFIRRNRRLLGTKIGCREGDCGACTVLIGSADGQGMAYRSMTSCLMPLANLEGKHLVTVEGLNREVLTPVQRAIVEEGGTQCGFCTVGFVVSLAGWSLSRQAPTLAEGIAAMDGNICRCTGYKSLQRAAARICTDLANKPLEQPIPWLVEQGFLPEYFRDIPQRLAELNQAPSPKTEGGVILGGGTDLFVQKPDDLRHAAVSTLFDAPQLKGISQDGQEVTLGAGTTVEEIKRSPLLQNLFPSLENFMRLVSSTPIRNMATVAGNFVNASPIGDLTVFFLALDAQLTLDNGQQQRSLPLRDFYKGYKQIDLTAGEWISQLRFAAPGTDDHFNFEKVSKRQYLDIASVNSAASLQVDGSTIVSASLSAGGVAPIPLFLAKTSAWLAGKPLNEQTIREAGLRAMGECAPISDARGTADYKRLLLRQLIYAHFICLFPQAAALEALV